MKIVAEICKKHCFIEIADIPNEIFVEVDNLALCLISNDFAFSPSSKLSSIAIFSEFDDTKLQSAKLY